MDTPVDQKTSATYFKSSQITCCEETEATFHLYLHQVTGSNANQISGNTQPGFGMIVVNDWAIRETTDPASKLVARAQGHHANCRDNKWCTLFNMAFQDESFNGSTLEVRGTWDPSIPFEWAVVGGTGQFTLAKGVIDGKVVRTIPNSNILELFIRIFYRTLAKPNMG